MKKFLCIHGHFYQPPREDPWLGKILPEGSAAPFRHWNERITRESYTPMAFARRLDGAGRIGEIVNCYELMSFNAGPTLMSWLARGAPDTHAAMVAADKASLARLGHGNALAQVYHHVIMPLAKARDKELEVAWAMDDFTARFGRAPEGMWLAEAAVDTPTLEVLAGRGIAFTILSPAQARAVAELGSGAWRPTHPGDLNTLEPYLVELPSGRSISVFFYNGPLSQAVAFERLLADGEQFWRRLAGAAGDGLLSLATDGETYGHHFKFGEMALAFALSQARQGRDGLAITNFAAHLAGNPPRRKVALHEPSSWSCAHGVERWRSDCGCTDGGHPGWQQRWRAPLRQALNLLKDAVDAHYDALAPGLFSDPDEAIVQYGRVLAGLTDAAAFQKAFFAKKLSKAGADTAWKILSMQQWALASFASCAWFFDEISRLEPVNGLTFALRALELARRTGAADLTPSLEQTLALAPSNLPELGNGKAIWRAMVVPRLETPGTLAGQATLSLLAAGRFPAEGGVAEVAWPGASVTVTRTSGDSARVQATAQVGIRHESGRDAVALSFPGQAAGDLPELPIQAVTGAATTVFYGRDLPWNKRQAIADAFAAAADGALWDRALELAATGIRLVPELQEAQDTLTLAPLWAGLWPALAWARVQGARLEPPKAALLDAYLRRAGRDNPAREAVHARIQADLAARLSERAPDFASAAGVIERAREIGLAPDVWAAQNALWAMRPLPADAAGLAALLGMAV
jgi:hypothetical protein